MPISFFRISRLFCIMPMLLIGLAGRVFAVPDDVTFPPPARSGGIGVFSALQQRRDVAQFDSRLLHWEVLGNLLWAAGGLNRPDDGLRTVPVLAEAFPVRIFLLAQEGVWRYEPFAHRLEGVESGDFRGMTRDDEIHSSRSSLSTLYPFSDTESEEAEDAPVVLLFAVAAQNLMDLQAEASQISSTSFLLEAALQAGHMAQNIQLAAASEGIGVHAHIPPSDRRALVSELGLSSEDHVLMILRLGYPAAQ